MTKEDGTPLMTKEDGTPLMINDMPGHRETRDALCDHIAASPHPRLAAASVLSSALQAAVIWNGAGWCEATLRNWLELLPELERDLREDQRGRDH